MKVMSNRRCILLAILGSFFFTMAYSQEKKTGDVIENLTFSGLFNYESDHLNLSKYKNKVIIFDFWSTNCIGCIVSFPKLDSIQNEYKDEIQIILVNKQSRDATEKFFKLKDHIKIPNVPFITGDSLLFKYFPVQAYPAIVWIDKDGVYKKMTHNISEDAVQTFLETGRNKESAYIAKSKYVESMFDSAYSKEVKYHSYISKVIPGVKLNGQIELKGGLLYSNTRLIDLFRIAYNGQGSYNFFDSNKLFIENPNIVDSLEIKFNYSLLLPSKDKVSLFRRMQDDLAAYTNISATIETRLIKSLVLTKIDGEDLLKTKGGEPLFNMPINKAVNNKPLELRQIRNLPIKHFINVLNIWSNRSLKMPLIDQTNYVGNVDIELQGLVLDGKDLDLLKDAIKKYNLTFEEKFVEVKVLVLR